MAMTQRKQAGAARIAPFRWLMKLAIRVALVIIIAVPALLVLYSVVPPVSTLMIGRWLTLQPVDRRWVSLDEIAPVLPMAVIASEDSRFCMHDGVDWQALQLVLSNAGEDGPSRGASTIPMQTVKNVVLTHHRSYIRKGLEIPLALFSDLVWSKRRTMEIYLNIAEWGEGIFGAEAAAKHYFGKSAQALSRREAALLASALPNPLVRSPARPTRAQSRTVNAVLNRMGNEDVSCLAR